MGVPPRTRTEHDYRTCRDEDCERFPCRVYREGYRHGYDDGRAAGYSEGCAAGFSEGLASCPGPHGGE